MIPTIGRIVFYRMAPWVAAEINARRKRQFSKSHDPAAPAGYERLSRGNGVGPGQLYPAMIVAVWGDTPDSAVNLQVFLDGNDTEWVTSVCVGTRDHSYEWPVVAKPAEAPKPEAAQ